MIAEKRHIGLLVFDDDKNKTPVANTRTEALGWWNTIPEEAKKRVKIEHCLNSEMDSFGWDDLVSVYRSVHHRNDAEHWWSNLSENARLKIINDCAFDLNHESRISWVDKVRVYFYVHDLLL